MEPVVISKGKPSKTLIFLHGLGDSGHGWSSEWHAFQKKHNHVKIILPTAPKMPVSVNNGFVMTAWHDIKSLETIDDEDFKGLDESKTIICNLIDQEVKSGCPSESIILGGFSQGAALSVYTGLQYDKKLGGIIALSGYLPFYKEFPKKINPANAKTPVLMCHGEKDPVVKTIFGQKSAEILKQAGVSIDWRTFKGMMHSTCPAEMSIVHEFILDKFK